ncbi:MAG: hypothetical protein JJE52_18990, partial [Acidimicrobiia bacterium]|nr:hypothetical protein [Acidimicrobiia bacterium]
MSTPATPPSLTVALHLDGRRCVVVGGGHVGQRRAVQMRRCGGDVVVISPELWPAAGRAQLESLGVEWVAREYRTGDLDGAFVVVAATGRSDVDAAVIADARASGALTNHVSDATAGDISLVATTETDHVQVSVSTDGRTPALTRWIRDRLADEIADGYPVLVELFAEARGQLRAAGRPTSHPGWDAALKSGLLELCLLYTS